MISLHLYQINFRPAYFSRQFDGLAEPLEEPGNACLGDFSDRPMVDEFLIENRASYILHLNEKLRRLVEFSCSKSADIVVFPEYSVPAESLLLLKTLSNTKGVIIVAGSHRVRQEDLNFYRKIDTVSDPQTGTSISPVLQPNSPTRYSVKSHRSPWEPDLVCGSYGSVPAEFEYGGFRFQILQCIDALHFSSYPVSGSGSPTCILCPASTPTMDPFNQIAKAATRSEVVLAVANNAQSGQSFVQLNPAWPAEKHMVSAPIGSESLIEFFLDERSARIPKGSINQGAQFIPAPQSFPIVYGNSSPWLATYHDAAKFTYDALIANDVDMAREQLELLTTDTSFTAPDEVVQQIRRVRLDFRNYTGDVQKVEHAMGLVELAEGEPTANYCREKGRQALEVCFSLIRTATVGEAQRVTEILTRIKSLIGEIHESGQSLPIASVARREQVAPLLASFQNRGGKLDELKVVCEEGKNVIFLTGPGGVGKTSTLKILFQKSLPDWNVFYVTPFSPCVPAMLLASIVTALHPTRSIDPDVLAGTSRKIFRQAVKRLGILPHRSALVIDDSTSLASLSSRREYLQTADLVEELTESLRGASGHRAVIFVSRVMWPSLKNSTGLKRVHLSGLDEVYMRRVLDHQARTTSSEVPEAVPKSVLEILGGNPLAARLAINVSRGRGFGWLGSSAGEKSLARRLRDEFLPKMKLSKEQARVLARLAVFQEPVDKKIAIRTLAIEVDVLEDLTLQGLVEDTGAEMLLPGIVQHYYRNQLTREEREKSHRAASEYYGEIVKNLRGRGLSTMLKESDLAYHRSMAGEPLDFNIEVYGLRLYEAGKQQYKRGKETDADHVSFRSAYQLFVKSVELMPTHVQATAYVGRCLARLGDWDASSEMFERSVRLAREQNEPTWWLWRDRGHLAASNKRLEEAIIFLDRADAERQVAGYREIDPSIASCRATIKMKEGHYGEAEKLFEMALVVRPDHGYTLDFYSRLMRQTGQAKRADELQRRAQRCQEKDLAEDHDADIEDLGLGAVGEWEIE